MAGGAVSSFPTALDAYERDEVVYLEGFVGLEADSGIGKSQLLWQNMGRALAWCPDPPWYGVIIDTDHWRHLFMIYGIVWGCFILHARSRPRFP